MSRKLTVTLILQLLMPDSHTRLWPGLPKGVFDHGSVYRPDVGILFNTRIIGGQQAVDLSFGLCKGVKGRV